MATSAPNLSKILSETRQIIKAQSRNFFAFSFLFLYPTSNITLLYLQSLLNNTSILLPAALALYVLNLVFSLCAAGSIIYTAFHGLSGEAIKLKSVIKYISSSFFPLLGTTLLVQIITLLIFLIFPALAIFGTLLFPGLRIDQVFSSPDYFMGLIFIVVLVVVLELVLIYLEVNWSLACVVVVVESAWGFKALKRSRTLIKGKRGIALSLYLIFGFVYGVLVWSTRYTSAGADEWMCSWLIFSLQLLITSGFLTLIQLYNVTATTVLYAYCKADFHDQKEFTGEYVGLLPDDDQKVDVV